MLSSDEVQQVVGADAYGSDGEKIGKIGQVFLDDQTGQPVFATVNTGLFGMSESFVPLSAASVSGGRVDVGFDRDRVKGAPNVSLEGGHLSPEEEQVLYDYYGLTYSPDDYLDSDRETTYAATTTDTTYVSDSVVTDDQASARNVDDDGGEMVRSEERLDISKRREVVGRARLRKYVVTENVTMTVPVRREKAVLEAIPAGADVSDIPDDEIVTDGSVTSGDLPEMILSEEVPVVSTVVQPVERIRLGKEEFTENETVTEELREERIEVEGDVTDPGETRLSDS